MPDPGDDQTEPQRNDDTHKCQSQCFEQIAEQGRIQIAIDKRRFGKELLHFSSSATRGPLSHEDGNDNGCNQTKEH